MVLRPAIMCGVEKAELTKTQEVEMKVAELKMLKLSLGIFIGYIRGIGRVEQFGNKVGVAKLI